LQGGALTLARVLHGTVFVILTWWIVLAGAQAAMAQALCHEADVRPFRETDVLAFDAGFLRAPRTITVEADLRGLGDTLPGGTWRMPYPGGLAWDGLALEGVSFTRNTEPKSGADVHTFDVVVDLRAWDSIVTDLEFVLVDGERSLRLGALPNIALRCEATSVSRTLSITDHDFVSFFGAGRAPTLRVKRTTHADGC
jgi:hypothetical protein